MGGGMMFSHIHRVSIEFSSYCNRKCDWCPNKTLHRNDHITMSDELYTDILKQLDENNFGKGFVRRSLQRVSFMGYNEPFAEPELLKKRVREAYDTLSKSVKLITNTNGDFVTKENLSNLMLDKVSIMDYDNKGMEYWEQKLIDLEALPINYDPSTETIAAIHRYIGQIVVRCNWSKNRRLENRGGYFKEDDFPQYNWDIKPRTEPCVEPEYFITIYCDGSVTPCCHIRPDNPEHQKYIMGNLHDQKLVDIYYSEPYKQFVNQLHGDPENYPEPCKFCQKRRAEACSQSPYEIEREMSKL